MHARIKPGFSTVSTLAAALFVVAAALPAAFAGDPAQQAQAAAGAVAIAVDAECKDGAAVFRIRNQGAAWPKLGNVAVYRTNGGAVINERQMRLVEGQSASFRIRSESSGGGEVALWVSPSWYARDFRYDARISC